MKTLRTPDKRFENLPDFPFKPNYVEVLDGEDGTLRIHYLDEGPPEAEPVLLMHGEPTWCYLYRKMIPVITQAGYRAIAPDLVGFGRSDKPADRNDYSYRLHMVWMRAWLEKIDAKRLTLVCQDWGGLIGLRLLAENPDRFARGVVANTGLPTGDTETPDAFKAWRKMSQEMPEFDVGMVMRFGLVRPVDDKVIAAYEAPFPDESYKEGARIFPSLVPITPDDPASPANRRAWEALNNFEKPFLTAFSDGDPITKGGDAIFRTRIPGTKNQPHTIIRDGGHFLQEDRGEEFAKIVVDFMKRT
ncbi:MAG: haloalkane dehalogenase [Proteobacteria bacterium]|nr:haloalkane dehalogenase [Pseudomonadota bacterium]